LLSSCGLKRHKYDNPITKGHPAARQGLVRPRRSPMSSTAASKSRGSHCRTLINTYDTSEYLAKAKLAIADSWFREGGAHAWPRPSRVQGLHPVLPGHGKKPRKPRRRSADIHYKQMEKADRDPCMRCAPRTNAASCCCSSPTVSFAPRGATEAARHPGSAGRRRVSEPPRSITPRAVSRPPPTDTRAWPTSSRSFSQADESLWQLADSYQHMATASRNPQVSALTRDRQGLSAERARRCRPGQAEGNEPAGAGSRSRGLRPH